MKNNTDLDKFSDIELKALAYDAIAALEFYKSQLNIINQELQKRSEAKQTI
jgi:hypothetical protein